MIVKVCGMRDAENIRQISSIEGIDWMGFIFTEQSKRYVHANTTFKADTEKVKVGVFVDQEIEEVAKTVFEYDLDIVQLHGFESPAYCQSLKQILDKSIEGNQASNTGSHKSIMKAFRVDSHFDFTQTGAYQDAVDYFLFDAKGVAAGGNGVTFDWQIMDRYDGEVPFLLAGGIDPNSIPAIKAFEHRKWIGIDVNSGFEEEPALKNYDALNDFVDKINSLKNPTSVVRQFVKRFNKGNALRLAELYHEDAINHQVTQEPKIGRPAIQKMFEEEFAQADMTCIPENIFESGDWAILEWKDPLGLRGCGFFKVISGKIQQQRGYWDKLSFLKMHKLPIPTN